MSFSLGSIQLNRLRRILLPVDIRDVGEDIPRWTWNSKKKFTVKSVFNHLYDMGQDRSFKHLWKAEIPLKIKIWSWLIWHNAIATKDNMLKRNWAGDPLCRFCPENEDINHLFFGCSVPFPPLPLLAAHAAELLAVCVGPEPVGLFVFGCFSFCTKTLYICSDI